MTLTLTPDDLPEYPRGDVVFRTARRPANPLPDNALPALGDSTNVSGNAHHPKTPRTDAP